MTESAQESRWGVLDDESDACAVVTRRMEVVYLNSVAESLVPEGWLGQRCWEVFPVKDRSCVSRCPAVQAISSGARIAYCEETVYPGGVPLVLGVAVVPLPDAGDGEGALLILRPKDGSVADGVFRRRLLATAERLAARGFAGR